METKQIGPVDMEISSSESIGTIECNVPVIMPENVDLVEGSNPLIRHLTAGYENERAEGIQDQPRSQGLRGETVTKTLVKFVLSFQNFGEKITCAVRHNRIQLYCNH